MGASSMNDCQRKSKNLAKASRTAAANRRPPGWSGNRRRADTTAHAPPARGRKGAFRLLDLIPRDDNQSYWACQRVSCRIRKELSSGPPSPQRCSRYPNRQKNLSDSVSYKTVRFSLNDIENHCQYQVISCPTGKPDARIEYPGFTGRRVFRKHSSGVLHIETISHLYRNNISFQSNSVAPWSRSSSISELSAVPLNLVAYRYASRRTGNASAGIRSERHFGLGLGPCVLPMAHAAAWPMRSVFATCLIPDSCRASSD